MKPKTTISGKTQSTRYICDMTVTNKFHQDHMEGHYCGKFPTEFVHPHNVRLFRILL